MGKNHAPIDKRNIAGKLNLNKKPNLDSHVPRYRRNTMDTNGKIGQGRNKQMSSCTRTVKQKKEKSEGTRDRNTNSEQLEFECQLKTPTRGRIHELLNLGASSSQNLFQSLITNQDLLRLREDMWPSHKTQRKGLVV